MSFRLVDAGWDAELDAGVALRERESFVISPFIKERAARRLLAHGRPGALRIITRFSLADMARGVADPSALRVLLKAGAQIRGVRHLHSKVYVFGAARAIVTSANLTEAALVRNHEFGFVAEDAVIVGRCRSYFDDLWRRAGPDLTAPKIASWEATLAAHHALPTPVDTTASLPDFGSDAGIPANPIELPPPAQEVHQAFVKFFGQGNEREAHDRRVLAEVERSGCHWACTYPKNRRPRSVSNGALMYFARLVREPHDILIYGRGIALAHDEQRDVATPAEIARRPWKAEWPNYIRVHDAEFVAGTLRNGVSVNALMAELGGAAFATTERNAHAGNGNTDPRQAYKQQPQVELAQRGLGWVHARLEAALARYGKLPAADLEALDWPAELP
jgi:hypothetical protein